MHLFLVLNDFCDVYNFSLFQVLQELFEVFKQLLLAVTARTVFVLGLLVKVLYVDVLTELINQDGFCFLSRLRTS
jgi:hypothetical protein